MKRNGYDEKTYYNPNEGIEVYGSDGYRWYTATEDAKRCAELFRGIELELSINTAWTYLVGMTSAKLRGKRFLSLGK